MSDEQKMTEITPLTENLRHKFAAEEGFSVVNALGETTLELPATRMIEVLTVLRDDKSFAFSQLIDLAGVDYLGYAKHAGKRFAVVYHLLSLFHNNRLRVRVFCRDDGFPLLDSTTSIWPAAGWCLNGRPLICLASLFAVTRIYGAFLRTTVLSVILFARIFPFPVMWKCATIRKDGGWYMSRSA